MLQLQNDYLELVAADDKLSALAGANRAGFSKQLNVDLPGLWPSDSMRDLLAKFADRLQSHPDYAGWFNWYWIAVDQVSGRRTLVGDGGFKGPPDEKGTIEIGYGILEPFRRRGYAASGVALLVDWAWNSQRVLRIVAETEAANEASVRVLRKNGFRYIGAGSQAELLRFRLERPMPVPPVR